MKNGTLAGRTDGAASHQSPPIIAVTPSGVVTKANAAARKVLASGTNAAEGSQLGVLLADYLGASQSGGTAALRVGRAADASQEILVVLSESEAQSLTTPEEEHPVPEPLNQRERADGSVADFIAHELRNPLSAILGISQVLEERYNSVSQEERQEALGTIHSEADKALLILQGLLRLAEFRIRDQLDLTPVPLHMVVRNVVAAHSRRNPHRFLTMSGDSPLFASANSMWTELALSNLLSNAEKHTPRDRRIEVIFRQVGSWATILVFDNGTGLRPELYRTLWDIYSRGPEDGVHVSGSGIGLALCKQLIEGMGGHVWAGPGKAGGSVFAVSLPSSCDMSVPPISGMANDAAVTATPVFQAKPVSQWS